MARDRVEIEVLLLDVFAMIAFAGDETEVAFLENRIALVPEGHRPAENLIAIAESCDSVLAPAIGFRSRQIVRQERPRIPVLAVVLAPRRPRAVRQVRTPLVPAGALVNVAGKALLFRIHLVDRTMEC